MITQSYQRIKIKMLQVVITGIILITSNKSQPSTQSVRIK